MFHLVDQRHPDHIAKPLSIAQGGTGKKSAQEVLAVLNGIAAADIGTANNPVPIAANGKIDSQYLPAINANGISLYGPAIVYDRFPTKFWISDFNINTDYQISATHGTVTRVHNELTYTSFYLEQNQLFNDEIVINGKHFPVEVHNSQFVTVETNNSYPLGKKQFIDGHALYVGQPPDNSYLTVTCIYSLTEALDNPISATVIFSKNGSHINFSLTTDDLTSNTLYYYKISIGYKDNTTNEFVLSANDLIGSFRVREYIFENFNQTVVDPDSRYSVSNFSDGKYGLSMSENGHQLVVFNACYNLVPEIGWTPGFDFFNYDNTSHLYQKTTSHGLGNLSFNNSDIPDGLVSSLSGDGNWWCVAGQSTNNNGLRCRMLNSSNPTDAFFMFSNVDDTSHSYQTGGTLTGVKMNYAGNVAVIGQDSLSYSSSREAALFILLEEENSSWNTHTRITIHQSGLDPDHSEPNCHFARAFDIDHSGNRIVVTANNFNSNGNPVGAAYVLKRVGNNYVLEQKLVPAYCDLRFGENVSISRDGLTIAISAICYPNSNDVSNGNVYIYKFNGTSWIEASFIEYPYSGQESMAGFGYSLKLNNDGTKIAIGAPFASYRNQAGNALNNNYGAVHIYHLRETSWVKVKEIYENSFYQSNKFSQGAHFGLCVDMTPDESVLAVSSPKSTNLVDTTVGAHYPCAIIYR